MSFLDRIKGKSRSNPAPDSVPPVPFEEVADTASPMEQTVRLGPGGAVYEVLAEYPLGQP